MTDDIERKLVLFECAEDFLGMLVAARTAWIYAAKDNPDVLPELIDQWESEQSELIERMLALDMSDEVELERLVDELGKEVRSVMAS